LQIVDVGKRFRQTTMLSEARTGVDSLLASNRVASPKGIHHFTQGRSAWQLGALGFLLRRRGQVTWAGAVGALAKVVSLIPTWINAGFSAWKTYHIVGGVIAAGAIALGGLEYLRRRTIRSLDIKYQMHQLSERIREEHARVFQVSSSGSMSAHQYGQALVDSVERICGTLREYFQLQINDTTVGVAIRLAVPGRDGEIVFRTFGRSGLSFGRNRTSQDIPVKAGIPAFLGKKQHSGILVIDDIQQAIELGIYERTKNDEVYTDDYLSCLIGPINGPDPMGKVVMIGLLAITSKRKNAFNITYTDSVGFAADSVASCIAFAVNCAPKS
jgi:hypothetical protein